MGLHGWLVRSVAVVGVMAVSACGGSDGGSSDDSSSSSEFATAEFSLQLSPDFTGNSVKLKGERKKDADKKYPCKNKVPEACYAFDAYGGLVEWDDHTKSYKEVKFDDLCPSDNAPEADWKWEFTLFTDDKCGRDGGEALNGAYDRNFTCFDSKDLFDQNHPNQSIDELKRGKNKNEIVCVTKNASKTFDFDVCVDETDDYSHYAQYGGEKIFDCGCKWDEYQQKCDCAQGLDKLPDECDADPYDYCNIVCVPAHPPVHKN